MTRFITILCTATFLFVSRAQADGAFHPSRVRLLVHGGLDMSDNVRLELRFVPAGNLVGELASVSYLGAKFKARVCRPFAAG